MRASARSAPLRIVAALVAAGLVLAPSGPARAGTAPVHPPPAIGTIVIPEIGFGYAVTSQGPLDVSRFPAGSPSASAAAGALSTLGSTIQTYQRSWQDAAGVNQVQDLVVRFSTIPGARAFVDAARRALAKAEIVSSRPLPSIPGARRTTYFASIKQAGVGQTVTMRVGDYAAVLSFFSGATGNPAPITPAAAERVAEAQHAALVSASGPATVVPRSGGGVSAPDVGWAGLAVVVVGVVVATSLLLRRHRRLSDVPMPASPGSSQ